MTAKKDRYVLGNILRGWFEGEFADSKTAWRVLSKRFLLSYPSSAGRSVSMYKQEINAYGFKQFILCREGVTWRGALSRRTALRCKRSTILGLNP